MPYELMQYPPPKAQDAAREQRVMTVGAAAAIAATRNPALFGQGPPQLSASAAPPPALSTPPPAIAPGAPPGGTPMGMQAASAPNPPSPSSMGTGVAPPAAPPGGGGAGPLPPPPGELLAAAMGTGAPAAQGAQASAPAQPFERGGQVGNTLVQDAPVPGPGPSERGLYPGVVPYEYLVMAFIHSKQDAEHFALGGQMGVDTAAPPPPPSFITWLSQPHGHKLSAFEETVLSTFRKAQDVGAAWQVVVHMLQTNPGVVPPSMQLMAGPSFQPALTSMLGA